MKDKDIDGGILYLIMETDIKSNNSNILGCYWDKEKAIEEFKEVITNYLTSDGVLELEDIANDWNCLPDTVERLIDEYSMQGIYKNDDYILELGKFKNLTELNEK